jgi:hypothetical protein
MAGQGAGGAPFCPALDSAGDGPMGAQVSAHRAHLLRWARRRGRPNWPLAPAGAGCRPRGLLGGSPRVVEFAFVLLVLMFLAAVAQMFVRPR